jgi:hypothetical protein
MAEREPPRYCADDQERDSPHQWPSESHSRTT